MNKYLTYILVGLAAYITPILGSLFFVGGLVMADWITGLVKGDKTGTFSSHMAITKFYTSIAYFIGILVARGCEMAFGGNIPMVIPVLAIISIAEVQSISENIKIITGVNVLEKPVKLIKMIKKK